MGEILWAVVKTKSGFRPLAPGRANKWPIQCFCAGGEEQAIRLCKVFAADEASTPQAVARRETRLEREAPKREYVRARDKLSQQERHP